MNKKETLLDRATSYLKNNPLVVILIILFLVITAGADLTDSLAKLGRAFSPDAQEGQTNLPVQRITSSPDAGAPETNISDFDKKRGTEPRSPSILNIEEAIRTIKSKSLTKFHISEFVERNNESTVQWEGVVLDVQKQWEHKDKSDYYIVFRANSKDERLKRVVIIAAFDYSKKADIAQVTKNYLIKIRGTLQFRELAGYYSIGLVDSELISFKAPKNN